VDPVYKLKGIIIIINGRWRWGEVDISNTLLCDLWKELTFSLNTIYIPFWRWFV